MKKMTAVLHTCLSFTHFLCSHSSMSFNGAKVIKTSYFMVWTVSGSFSELGKRINACNLDVALIYFHEKIQRIYICT
jgi:hypothetical protein